MSKVTIYHNPRCSKSRQTLALLEERGIKPEIVYYLDKPPSTSKLKQLLKLLKLTPAGLMRKGEADYKALDLNARAVSESQLIDIMRANPILIERPIVETDTSARIGRPPESVLEIV